MIERSNYYTCDSCCNISDKLYDAYFDGLDYPITLCKECMEKLIKEYKELGEKE